MEKYIFSIIKVGEGLILGAIPLFVIWYIVKDILDMRDDDRD